MFQTTSLNDQATLIAAFKADPSRLQAETIEVFETHLSWVLVAPPFAYKIKKAVHYDFVDYRTIAQRQHYCEEELRKNKALAACLYLTVIPIYGTWQQPSLIPQEASPIEYAVKMSAFPQAFLFRHQLTRGHIGYDEIKTLAKRLAFFHEQCPPQQTLPHYWRQLRQACISSLALIETRHGKNKALLNRLRTWLEATLIQQRPLLEKRLATGWVRDMHGDLHLDNILYWQQTWLCFDCIEFNTQLSTLDLQNELAFLLMDLEAHHYPKAALQLLNTYLELTQDYTGTRLLPLFKMYRALVRAKLALLMNHQLEYLRYIRQAKRYLTPAKPFCILMCGVSASGKTTLANQLINSLSVIKIGSDPLRTRLITQPPFFTPDKRQQVYEALYAQAQDLLAAGLAVLVDATFLEYDQRQRFYALAKQYQVTYLVILCVAPFNCIRQRFTQREAHEPILDADLLTQQWQTYEPLTQVEWQHAYRVDTSECDLAVIQRDILARL